MRQAIEYLFPAIKLMCRMTVSPYENILVEGLLTFKKSNVSHVSRYKEFPKIVLHEGKADK